MSAESLFDELEVQDPLDDLQPSGFVAHLSQFEGPLDLLLHLIRRAKIDIQDIFLTDITEQYLAFMGQVETMDMEHASGFLVMASTLLEIKARKMLPAPPEPEPDEEDLAQQLIAQLEEYQLFVDISGQLRTHEHKRSLSYSRLMTEDFGDQELVFQDTTAQALYDAFAQMLARKTSEPEQAAAQPSHEVAREAFSIQTCMNNIQKQLIRAQGASINFVSLFPPQASRALWVTTFLALLELMRQDKITVQQTARFGPIELTLATPGATAVEPAVDDAKES